MTVQDTVKSWGADPADRWVMVRAEISCSGLWHTDGMSDTVEGLPSIPLSLAARIEAFETWYGDLDEANDAYPEPPYWEQDPSMPIAAFNEEGRSIARALKAALPDDWTVVYEDVDAWLGPKGVPLETRQLILAGTAG